MMRNLMTLLLFLLGSSVAFAQSAEKLLPADRTVDQAIDYYIDAKLKETKTIPAPLADDAERAPKATKSSRGSVRVSYTTRS